MNPLQEHPNLFTNGKFKVDLVEAEKYLLNPGIFTIHGYHEGRIINSTDGLGTSFFMPQDCTLIARPIEDMSNYEDENSPLWDRRFEQYHYTGIETPEDLLYLLSIGVYPFNQEHFNDGTVLNINEVT